MTDHALMKLKKHYTCWIERRWAGYSQNGSRGFFVLPTVAFVQDMVDVAVKLKSKLLKPSVLLPMGRYLAGIQHYE